MAARRVASPSDPTEREDYKERRVQEMRDAATMMNSSPSTPPPPVLSRQIAHVLDSLIKLPGSTRRIGLDPILGLIPGAGDALAAALGSIILVEAMRARVPRLLLMRMGGNLLINAGVGAIPIAGDLFSVWFQSNARNYALLRAWQTGGRKSPAGSDGAWVAAGCVFLIILAAGVCALACWLFAAMWRWIAASN